MGQIAKFYKAGRLCWPCCWCQRDQNQTSFIRTKVWRCRHKFNSEYHSIYRPPKDNIANIYVFIKLLPWEWEGQAYGIKKGHSLQNKLQSKSSLFPSLNFSCFKRVLCIFIGWTESVSQWLLNYSSGRCTQRAYTLSDNLFHFTFSQESHDGVGGR